MREKRLFVSIDIQKFSMLGSLRHLINRAGSTTSFSHEDAFPSVGLSAKKTETFLLMIVIVKRIKIISMS